MAHDPVVPDVVDNIEVVGPRRSEHRETLAVDRLAARLPKGDVEDRSGGRHTEPASHPLRVLTAARTSFRCERLDIVPVW